MEQITSEELDTLEKVYRSKRGESVASMTSDEAEECVNVGFLERIGSNNYVLTQDGRAILKRCRGLT